MLSHTSPQKNLLDHSQDFLKSQKTDVLKDLADKLFYVVIVIGSLIGIVSAIHIAYKGYTFDSVSDIFFVTSAILIMVFHKKIPSDLLAIFLISLVGIDGLSKLLESGLNGLAGLSLAVSCIAIGVFFGLRASMVVLAGIITAIVTTAGLSCSGTLHLHDNPNWGSPISWTIRLLTITIYVSALGLLISGIQQRLTGSLKALSERSSELENSNVQLTAEIASRRTAEESLTKEEQKYRLLAENMRDVLVVQDLNNKVLYISPSVKTVFGYDVDEALSLPVDTFFTPESWKFAEIKFGQLVALALQGDRPTMPLVEIEYRRKDGSTFKGELSSQFLYDSDGRPYGTQCLVRDISERKKAEDERLKIESHLYQVQKLESLGLLAGGIAHDFNNLMGGIFGYIDLARSKIRDTQTLEYLDTSLATINRARALTLQLLTFAKGGAPIQKTARLVPFIQETVQFALSGSTISCEFFLAEDLWLCNIDKDQISQVIDNIVINAQQAMSGGGTITVSAGNISFKEEGNNIVLPRGNYVKISIKDSGIGIPKEVLPRIFDPFYSTKATGHGLGLATSYSIVKRHGGCIEVESEPGKGSTFHVYLPASRETIIADTVEIASHKGSGRIIIMDDEGVVRTAIQKMLESMGYTAACKNDGWEAIDFFINETSAERQFAAMIFDLTIHGGMGGKEAVTEIRKLDKKIPVFVVSGYTDDPVMKNPNEYGFTASLCKPFTMAELAKLLDEYLKTDNC